MGATDIAEESRFVWHSGEEMTWNTWSPIEPDNANANENCVAVESGSKTWRDLPCTDMNKRICEMDKLKGIPLYRMFNMIVGTTVFEMQRKVLSLWKLKQYYFF